MKNRITIKPLSKNKIKITEFFLNSKNVKSLIILEDNKIISKKNYNEEGELHSTEEPAYYSLEGNKEIEHWYFKGKSHRDKNRPAFIERINGDISRVMFYKNGKLHRTDGPALLNVKENSIWYRINGKVKKRPSIFWIKLKGLNCLNFPLGKDFYLEKLNQRRTELSNIRKY